MAEVKICVDLVHQNGLHSWGSARLPTSVSRFQIRPETGTILSHQPCNFLHSSFSLRRLCQVMVPADQTPFEVWNDLCIKVGLSYKCDETLTVLFLCCAQLIQLFLSLNAQCQDIRSHFLNMPLIQECCQYETEPRRSWFKTGVLIRVVCFKYWLDRR